MSSHLKQTEIYGSRCPAIWKEMERNKDCMCERVRGRWRSVLWNFNNVNSAAVIFFCVIPGRLFYSSHCSGVFPLPLLVWRWITLLLHMHEIGLLLLTEQPPKQRRAYEACQSQTISYLKVFEFIISSAVGLRKHGQNVLPNILQDTL